VGIGGNKLQATWLMARKYRLRGARGGTRTLDNFLESVSYGPFVASRPKFAIGANPHYPKLPKSGWGVPCRMVATRHSCYSFHRPLHAIARLGAVRRSYQGCGPAEVGKLLPKGVFIRGWENDLAYIRQLEKNIPVNAPFAFHVIVVGRFFRLG